MTAPTAFYQLAARVEAINNSAELGFAICNETRQLVDYRQAALLSLAPSNRAKLVAHSGLSDTDNNTPYALWLADVAKEIAPHCRALPPEARVLALSPAQLSEPLAAQWNEWLPPHWKWV